MERQLFCVVCTAKRTIDLARPGIPGGAAVTCFRCGGLVFSTLAPAVKPNIPWFLTAFDRELLKRFHIARGSVPMAAVRR